MRTWRKKECQEAGKEFLLQAYQGDARKLKRFAEDTFDLTLLFGPMYHLYSFEDKLQALTEAKRVTRPGGLYSGRLSDERIWCAHLWF